MIVSGRQQRDSTIYVHVSILPKPLFHPGCRITIFISLHGSMGKPLQWTPSKLLAPLVAQMVKNLPPVLETWVQSLSQKDLLEKGIATHSSNLAWRIPQTEEPGGLQSVGSQRVEHNWSDLHCLIVVAALSSRSYFFSFFPYLSSLFFLFFFFSFFSGHTVRVAGL